MLTILIVLALVFTVIYFFLWLSERFFGYYQDTPFGFKARLFYSDKGIKSRVFTSNKYKLAAKPDFIYQLANGDYVLIEYKSRKGRVYPSDIQQVLAAIIATRSVYPIREAYVHTDTTRLKIDATVSDEELFDNIKRNYELTKQIKQGKKVEVCYKSDYKCNTCSMRKHCHI